jgi:hypothetical protein
MRLKYVDTEKTPHAYYLDGKRCKGVTGVAGIPDDTYGLDQWKQRNIVLGMALEPALVERASAHYDDREQLQQIASSALRAARTHEAADKGTALHAVLERHDLGGDIIDTPLSRAARAAWDKALKEAKITVDPDLVERILVYPQQRIAGRMDRFVQVGRATSRTVLDLKTGAISYPHKIAIQLALYARANHMAGVLDKNGVTEEFADLPDMDNKYGLIVHMPTPEEIQIVKIDIAAGWKAAQDICFKTLDWRANKSLVKPFVSVDVVDPLEKATDEQIASIKARLLKIQEAGDTAKRICAARWPNNVAKPKQSSEWSAADIERIEARLETTERDCEIPF